MSASPSFDAIEDDRLSAHFEWVIAILRAQDTSSLDAGIAARRAATIARLETYAERGVFPRNTVSLEQMLPAFVDDCGVACAVADLMMGSGDDGVKLAGRIRDRLNFASVGEMLVEMPDALEAWAERAGLTRVEMALVQPRYGCSPAVACWRLNESPPGFGDCAGPDACCEYFKLEDGGECEIEDEYGEPVEQGICHDGSCDPKPEPEEVDDHAGCDCSMTSLGAGSIAPLLAAVVLLAWRRRAARHPGRVGGR